MNQSQFLAKAIEHLIEQGKSVKLINRKSVSCSGIPTGGYCTGSGISVAVKHNYWFETFVHEYCHFLQEQDENYNPDETGWEEYDEWLLGKKELAEKQLAKYTKDIRDCEVDCEKRVVQLIKKYRLPIKEKLYIQEANTYALFYTLATKYRMWYDKGESPCGIPELVGLMPTEFKKSWNRVPREFERIVREKCFKLS